MLFSVFIFIHFIHEVFQFRRRFLTYYLTVNKNCVLALFLSFPEWFSPPELLIPITVSSPGLTSEAMWNFLHEWPDNSIDKRQGRMIFLCLYRWRRQLSMAWESKKSRCEDDPGRPHSPACKSNGHTRSAQGCENIILCPFPYPHKYMEVY